MYTHKQWLFKRYKGYALCMQYYCKFGMLQVRENTISLRRWSGAGVAHLHTLEGTLALREKPFKSRTGHYLTKFCNSITRQPVELLRSVLTICGFGKSSKSL